MEEWRFIKDYQYYMVSNTGQVKSLPREVLNGRGYKYFTKEKILKQCISNGYYSVNLSKNGIEISKPIHRLVAETWIPNPNNLPETNHCDGNKLNNHISNLEWASYSDNLNHALRTGLNNNKGETHYNVKLTDAQIQEIRLLKGIMTQRKIGEMFGVSQQHICDILNNHKR